MLRAAPSRFRPARESSDAARRSGTLGAAREGDVIAATIDHLDPPRPESASSADAVGFSFVVPAYNEAERLLRTLPEMKNRIPELTPGRSVEIVVVDDGSTDDTASTARDLLHGFPGTVLSYPQNRGKGHALVQGMLAARGALRLFSDADLSTPLDEIPRFLAAHDAGAGIVIGSRKRPGARLERRQPVFRESMGRAYTFLANLFVMSGVTDFTCGFKSFRAAAAERIFPELTVRGWSFDVELLWLARVHGIPLRELPVTWKNDPQTKVHLRRDAIRSFAGLLRTVKRRHRIA